MKGDLIVVGAQYVVSLKPEHVLIPGTDITYAERAEALDKLDLDTLPRAAIEERRRLDGALGYGLRSRLERCEGVFRTMFDGHRLGVGDLLDQRVGTLMTVVDKQPKAVTVEAEFGEQDRLPEVGHYFDPSLPLDFDDDDLVDDDDLDEDEVVDALNAWERERLDPAGTLRAVVHPQAVRYLYDDTLLTRLDAEWREQERRLAAEREQRYRELGERNAAKIAERWAEGILRATNRPPRPPDDDWKPLA